MLFRRELLGKAAVGAAAAVTLSVARTGAASTRAVEAATGAPAGDRDGRSAGPTSAPAADTPAVASAAPPPWALLSPLAAGAVVASGWRLVDLSPVRDGSCVVTLGNERGRSHRIHLCRNDGSPQGIVYTRGVDLVVMNGGQSDLPTEEALAQAVAAVAHTVAANETQVPEVLGELLAHTERVRRYATAEGPEADGKLR